MGTEQSELVTWLAELEAEVAAKLLVIASVRQRLGLDPSAPAGSTAGVPSGSGTVDSTNGPLRSDTFFRLSIPDAIKKYLAMAKRPQSPKDIAAALKQGGVLSQATHFYANVTTALKRLRESGDVVNTKEGWGLAAWYPNKPKQNDPPRSSKAKRRKKKAAVGRVVAKVAQKATKAQDGGGGTHDGGAMNWHQFMGAAAKAGKTMKEASAEWKQRKASGA